MEKTNRPKCIHLSSVNTGVPAFVIVLSERFNELANEQFITPDFTPFTELEYIVKRGGFILKSRQFFEARDQSHAPAIAVYAKDNMDLMDDIITQGADNVLMPLMEQVMANMEEQLETEVGRLQGLMKRAPI